MSLRDKILSEGNIYTAIYGLESYVFEKGLLSDDDLELYNSLHDKFDFELIKRTISDCQKRIIEVLDKPEEMFEVEVFFKIKKWKEAEDGKLAELKYRPLHTAKLIDQICMVSMLMPLMFDDTSGKRKRSELTKIIPHDFYGNIPSTSPEYLFKPWLKQYKAYNDHIIERCREYRDNHKYRTEITFDIKEFFPSISPAFIFRYVLDKFKYVYKDEDETTLRTILSKLLIFKIEPQELKGWESVYYGDDSYWRDFNFRVSRGIVQGLPQSYFFGNLCMIEIRQRLKKMPVFHNCDASFYVDDSVIYVESDFTKAKFDKLIEDVNSEIKDIGHEENMSECFENLIRSDYLTFQSKLAYHIKFHDKGKSEFCRIEDAGISIAGLEPLARNVSLGASIYSNTDETEDEYCRDKLEKIEELVENEIKRLKKQTDNTSDDSGDAQQQTNELKDKLVARLKLLKRYKRFYLYRLHLLERRLDSSGVCEEDVKNFFEHFRIGFKGQNGEISQTDGKLLTTIEEWFETFEEDVFQTEAREIISLLPQEDVDTFLDVLVKFEKDITEGFRGNPSRLYFAKDFKASSKLRELFSEPYRHLTRIIRRDQSPIRTLSSLHQKTKFEEFSRNLSEYIKALPKVEDTNPLKGLLPEYTWFVLKNSCEYIRKILNAYYSAQNEVIPSDSRTFIKQTSRGLDYTELRILTRLRNRRFSFKGFLRFLEDLDAKDLDNRMSIDMGLLDVIGIFISRVKNPEWIDNIILTHRVVKGLWYNGSKFMNSYTLHNEEHAVTLIKQSVRLEKAIDYFVLKDVDFYILFLACYLHDISMVIHPNVSNFCRGNDDSSGIISDFITSAGTVLNQQDNIDNEETELSPGARFKMAGHSLITKFNEIYEFFSESIRSSHAFDSARYIREWKDSVLRYLSPVMLSHVAKASESHGWNMEEVYGLKSEARMSLVSEKYTMMLIRLADLMDVASDRINYNLLRQNVSHMGEVSRFHWISHLITDEIRIAPTYKADNKTDKPIQERQIIERLNFNLFINVKYLTALEGHCGLCKCIAKRFDKTIITLMEEHSDCDGMMLELFNLDNYSYPKSSDKNSDNSEFPCPVMCRWIVKKHEWMVKELAELNKYLNSVNDRWFRTEIRLNILFRDEFPLDPDLYDSVQEYISK